MEMSTQRATRELLAYTLNNDRRSLLKLLRRNGIELADNVSDKELTVAVLMAAGRNSTFKKELTELLSSKVKEAGEKYLSFVADDEMFGFTGIDDFLYQIGSISPQLGSGVQSYVQSQQKSTTAKSTRAESRAARKAAGDKTGAGNFLAGLWDFAQKNVFTEDNLKAGINAGVTSISNKATAKQNLLQGEANAIEKTRQDLAQVDAQQRQGELPKPKLSPTTTAILIGVGVLLLGGIGYMIYKSRKK